MLWARRTAALALTATALIILAGVVTMRLAGVVTMRDHLRLVAQPTPAPLSVVADTRLLVFAPHPDDEVIAAGGLIQQVREAGGTVHVVYLTSGDSYTESVRVEEHVAKPRSADYRAYGHQREDEARAALRTLGVGAWSLTFLGFPNGGLNGLMSTYWSDKRSAYRSPYTRMHRPSRSESFISDTEYRGEDLTEELAEIIGDFKPSIMLVPRPEDQHADHCATWFFVADALGDVTRVHPHFHTDLVNYIVHYYSWPFEDDEPFLKPPEGLDPGVSGWLIVPLSDREVDTKREALHRFKSQMRIVGWFLDGFARRNEVFSRPAPPRVALPVRNSVCDEFEARPHSNGH
jgi:LmbE family N-acetylglucosaminyl deacetylase